MYIYVLIVISVGFLGDFFFLEKIFDNLYTFNMLFIRVFVVELDVMSIN